MPTEETDFDGDAREILKALAIRKNVIIVGPPGTGKSRLLNLVREHFRGRSGTTGADPYGEIAIPDEVSPLPEWYPSHDQLDSREVFQTVFDQNTKYRDFMRGLVPNISVAGGFTVTQGTLYRAADHASRGGNAALVIVDEINRGPAVAAFGSALVGLEADKRLPRDGVPLPETQHFEILGDDGEHMEFALPEDLYLLAAMNEADTSVEPLDVAFLRRFHIHRLEPRPEVLRAHFGLDAEPTGELPDAATSPVDCYEALVRAFQAVNDLILLARGHAYQLGHGGLMHASAPSSSLAAAHDYMLAAWTTLRSHVDEVFFGNTRAVAEILRAENSKSPYRLEESMFAGQTVRRILGPSRPTAPEVYSLLKLISSK